MCKCETSPIKLLLGENSNVSSWCKKSIQGSKAFVRRSKWRCSRYLLANCLPILPSRSSIKSKFYLGSFKLLLPTFFEICPGQKNQLPGDSRCPVNYPLASLLCGGIITQQMTTIHTLVETNINVCTKDSYIYNFPEFFVFRNLAKQNQ